MTKPVSYFSHPLADEPYFDALIENFGPRFERLNPVDKKTALVIASYAVRNNKGFTLAASNLELEGVLPRDFCEFADYLSTNGLLSLCESLINQLRWG